MPLFTGTSNSVISQNVRELRNSGKSSEQAFAISLKKAGKSKNKKFSKKVAKTIPKKIKATL